jgi:hypothetical protein
MKRIFAVLLAAALASCADIQTHQAADATSCHDITLPAFHYSDCPVKAAP